jgi:predicted TIM-barrel fold metal-dependent hydrolase
MKIDLHVHVADIETMLDSGRPAGRAKATGYLRRVLRSARKNDLVAGHDGDGINDRWLRRLAGWVRESPLDAVVLLALDAVYDESGAPRRDKTVLEVTNDFVASAAEHSPQFFFGASVHPYRRDAVEELERVVAKGACLIKWIPSAQHIQPDSPRCYPLFEAMAHYNVPLLCHTGVEHMLGFSRSSLNHPSRLVPALKRGVTVIAAHCGAHLFLHEPSFVGPWSTLARQHENLYGDTGAFSIVTRIPCLKRILHDPILKTKLLYGSDFPGIPSPRWCWQLGARKMRALSRIENPLARNICVMQALGMRNEVFERAHTRLGLHKESADHDL